MEQQAKIAVDTNMLFAQEQFKVRIVEEIQGILHNAKIFVPMQVLEELEKLEGKSKRLEKQARIARQVLKEEKIGKIKVFAENADKALLLLSKKGFIIATNDKALRKKIKESNGKCITLRKKKYLILE